MSEDFDPYRKWLGIPPKDQPPNHYRLLGIPHFEDDPDVIENAATRQMVHIRTYQSGKYSAASQKILNELAAAKLCLLQPDRKREYDFTLRRELEAAGKLSSEAPLEAGDEEGMPPPPPADFRSPQGGRWRTSPENDSTGSSPELAPVPIPMPPVGNPPPVVSVQSRRPNYSNIRSRKKSSGMPVVLILCSVALLALGGIVAVIIATQQPATAPHQVKHPKSEHTTSPPDRSITKKPAPATTPFPVGSNPRPPQKTIDSNKTQPISSRSTPRESGPEAVAQDPRTELTKARQALEHRDDGNFRLHISQTEYLLGQNKPADFEMLKAEETHLRDIEKLLNNFWQAVREGADKKIPKGEKISFKRHKLEIVAREGDQLTYKFDDVEHTIGIKKLPPSVAMYMALRVFGQDNLDGKIAIVVFQLIDIEAARDPVSQRLSARLLEDIEKAGVSENPILVRERSKATKPPADTQQELSGPLILSSTAPPDKPFEPKIGAATNDDPKKLDPMLVKEAREQFDKKFRARLLEATDKLDAAKSLLTDLNAEITAAETAEFKVKLLKEANELAAKLGDSASIVKASEQIAALGGEPALDVQTQLFGRLNLEADGAAKELLQHAQSAASKAEANGELFHAAELLKIAKKAAEKANLSTEQKTVEEKLQAVEKARAAKK